ncbi:MAG: FecR domain-containing protein [Geobacteraceae bacterium]|nr:FecR domain-containing protein [Geobacteraceae bacterium]
MKRTMLLIPCIFSIISILPAGAADNGQFVELSVTKGDSLVNICRKYLQDPGKWPEIGRVNKLKDNNRINPGQRLKIPVRLLRGVPADGTVTYVRGDVAVLPERMSQWQALQRNDHVRQGSLMRTGHDSGVEIVFDDGTSILQKQDTVLGLQTSEYKGNDHLLRRLRLSSGRVLTKVRRATGKETRFEIRTPSATAVARGTDFRVSSGMSQETTSEVLEGSVDVAAMGKTVAVHEGEGTRINKGKPPLPPRKLLQPPVPPRITSPLNSMPIQLPFQGVEGSVAYRFLLSRDAEGKELLQDKVYPVKEPATATGLKDGRYFIQAASIDGQGIEGPASPAVEITVRTHPLPPFVQTPSEGAKHRGNTLKFKWLQVQDAKRYQFQTAADREFREAAAYTEETGDTEFSHRFSEFGTFYFRVRSVAADGYAGAWSDAVSFTIAPPPPSPEMEKPALAKGELRIRWGNRGAKVNYHCQVSMDREFKSTLIDTRLDKPEIAMSAPDKPGVYYVRTSTIDPDGCEGDFSPAQTFEIKRRWPYAAGAALGVAGIILLILL